MRIDWWTLAFQTVNVLVLVWLLSRFLFKPVSKIMTERQQAAAALIQDASTARDAAERDRKQAAEQTAALDAFRLQRLGEITTEAELLKTSLVATARTEAAAIRAAAANEIALLRKKAAREDAARATGFAAEIASRLLSRLPPRALVEGFIGPLAHAVSELPNEVRQQLGEQSDPLHLLAPRPLSDDELAQCRAALADALGHETPLQIEANPILIAGLELVAPHVIVRNSFRHDLETLKAELLSHDHE
ncbi:F0F1 ATP synthase subunit B family protein [Trinickia soli]|uniref:F0F1 ATP synthase subunit B family protein n=1 Tax=Trinickia soli TaxID=380675 RepID=UPI001254FF9C|nr:F0F1 ATP synthase subunit B [Paraburkholderia sp. T12-10]